MSRDGSGVYHRPLGTDAVPDTTIESSKYNNNVWDVEQDLNTPRPIVAGGTAATSADGALDNLSAEKMKQVVTNWDTASLRAGSLYATTTATGTSPVSGHAFAGICYYANAAGDLVVDVTDITAAGALSANQYLRMMTGGVWGPWIAKGTGLLVSIDYIFINSPILSGPDFVPLGSGQFMFDQPNITLENPPIAISHLTASGTNLTQVIPTSLKNGTKFTVTDAIDATKYIKFTVQSDPAPIPIRPSGFTGDFWFYASYQTIGGGGLIAGRKILITTGS